MRSRRGGRGGRRMREAVVLVAGGGGGGEGGAGAGAGKRRRSVEEGGGGGVDAKAQARRWGACTLGMFAVPLKPALAPGGLGYITSRTIYDYIMHLNFNHKTQNCFNIGTPNRHQHFPPPSPAPLQLGHERLGLLRNLRPHRLEHGVALLVSGDALARADPALRVGIKR